MPKSPRRLMVTITAVVLAIGGCSVQTQRSASEVPVVLTTFTVLADIASNVAGDRLQIESIIEPGTEVHAYEPKPGDLRRAARASLIVDNGLNLEAWFEKFLTDADAERVVVSEGVDPIGIDGGSAETTPNPHAWMSPVNVAIYVDNLVGAFSELDPDGAREFEANGSAYKEQVAQVHRELVDALAGLPEDQRALVTCEGAFSYLARDTGLAERYIWPVNAERQATPLQVASTIDFVRDNSVPAVFCESTVSDAAMAQVVEATDARFGGVLYVDSLTDADGPVPTYLDLLRHDARVIVEGLTGVGP